MLTAKDIRKLLEILSNGQLGYSDDPEIARIQAMLSIMLEARVRFQGDKS